jgi:hypothetical protein
MIDERSDAEILGDMPEFVSIPTMLKSIPREESGERCLYIEASNEDVDHQGEVVLQKALSDSTPYFLRHGNIDLSHYTLLGPKAGIPNFLEYEIGRPVEARTSGKRTFVKAQLYKGEGARARNANMVWDSLTKQKPASPWFASVGGSVLSKAIKEDPANGMRVGVITAVRWNNLALDRGPVNKTVGEVSLAPIGTFAKSLGGFVIAKGLDAGGYGADSAALSGGAALRMQSLDHGIKSYWDFRNKMADAIRGGECGQRAPDMVQHAAKQFGLSHGDAAEYVERFMRDLQSGLKQRKAQ